MKSKIKVIVAAFALLLVSVTATYAQGHNVGKVGKGPHGGTVQEADPNHAEVLVKNGKVYIYILDGDAEPISNKGITGKATLQFKDGHIVIANLVDDGADGFVVDNANAAAYSNCIVTAKVNGKSVSAKFKNYATVKAPAATHQH
jgi:hypothetical protein